MSDRERAFFRRRCVGFVFQFFNLLPTLTAAENVALPLLLARESHAKSVDQARGALERVGLRDRADHFPDEMSGGEMQRVAIARALIAEPDAVLCDEPTGNLDSVNSAEILKLLRSLPETEGRSVVMVTHDPHAAAYGDRLVLIRDGLVEIDRQQEPSSNGAPAVEAIRQAGGIRL
jgi:putative ABC transport system ATP-binding protein